MPGAMLLNMESFLFGRLQYKIAEPLVSSLLLIGVLAMSFLFGKYGGKRYVIILSAYLGISMAATLTAFILQLASQSIAWYVMAAAGDYGMDTRLWCFSLFSRFLLAASASSCVLRCQYRTPESWKTMQEELRKDESVETCLDKKSDSDGCIGLYSCFINRRRTALYRRAENGQLYET